MQTETVPQEDVKPPAPETVTDKTETAETAEKAETEKPKPPEGYVPHQALHSERIQRRRLERDLAEERMKREQATQRFEEAAKRFFKTAEPAPPSVDEDPVGAITHETRQTREEVAALRKEREEEKKQTDVQRQQQAFAQAFDQQARAFASKQPDFTKAQDHVFVGMVEEYEEAGFSREEAEQGAWNNWRAVVNRAFQDGVNPAERLYKLAQRRGYKGQEKAQDKLDTIVNGTKATSPLSASGKAPGKLDAKAVADMPQEDFDKLSDADFKRIFGG